MCRWMSWAKSLLSIMNSRVLKLTLFLLLVFFSAAAQTDSSEMERRKAIKVCRSLLKESLKEIDKGNLENSITLLDSVFSCDPHNADAFYHKARILCWQGDTASAIAVLTTGVESAPRSTRLKLLLARHKLNKGAVPEASELIESVLAIKPREGWGVMVKGVVVLPEAK